MSRFTSSTRHPSTGHAGGVHPPFTGGGDDRGGRGSGDSLPNYGLRLRNARLALAVFMTPICMLFLSFTVVYLIRRGYLSFDTTSDSYVRSWIPVSLPWALLLVNTAILLFSSFTIERARRAITREAALSPVSSIPGVSLGDERHFPWLSLTTVLGLLFLAGQLLVWNDLSRRGFHMIGGTSSSFVYMLTAMHGIHLAGGILALLVANIASLLHRPVESRRIIVDVTSWYWHLMAGLWIYILVLFSFAAQ
jgi:cytochrome c oxidase subunit 3